VSRIWRHRAGAAWVLVLAAVVLITVFGHLPWLVRLGDAVVIPAGFWAGAAFILYYTLLAPWWHNPLGRMVVQLDLAVMLVTGGPTFSEEFGVSFSSATEVRLLFSGLILAPVTIISRLLLLGALHDWVPRLPWHHRKPPGKAPAGAPD
jgi:hypothetical protein